MTPGLGFTTQLKSLPLDLKKQLSHGRLIKVASFLAYIKSQMATHKET